MKKFTAYLRVELSVIETAWKSHGCQGCQIKIWWQTHNVIKLDKIDPVFFLYPCMDIEFDFGFTADWQAISIRIFFPFEFFKKFKNITIRIFKKFRFEFDFL